MKLETDIKYFKAKLFALRIFKLCKYLKQEKSEYEIAKQIFRSGTSIGANIAEAQYAESNSDFVHKLRIAVKEAMRLIIGWNCSLSLGQSMKRCFSQWNVIVAN